MNRYNPKNDTQSAVLPDMKIRATVIAFMFDQ